MRWILLSLLLLSANFVQANCVAEQPCLLETGRSYHVKPPDKWDGKTPLPVMLHFHGWGRQGTLIVKHARISGATRRRGVLLLAPNGVGKSWDFWRTGSPDVAFAKDVLADAAKRYPIDWDNVFVSGYSYGAAMAWRFGCEAGQGVRAVLAVSGTISQNEICSEGLQEIRHVHGLTDTVLDFPYGLNGDEDGPVALWRQEFSCTEGVDAGTWSNVPPLKLRRKVWDCVNGRRVILDVHPSGHFIPKRLVCEAVR